MSWQLVWPEQGFSQLKARLLRDAPLEAGAILRCNRTNNRLLVFSASVAGPEDCVIQSSGRLEFSPKFVAREVKAAREYRQSVILVHTHPFDQFPAFSPIDDEGEKALIPAIQARTPNQTHGALVIGLLGYQGRVYRDGGRIEPISRVLSVGSHLDWLGIDQSVPVDDAFDRNVRAFGERGQQRLRDLHVGIVGLGGTGSVVAQQLAYLGVKTFSLFDPDHVELSNLNRVVGATRRDIGLPKVDVASAYIRNVAASAVSVRAYNADVLNADTAKHLLDCDVIFSCTDTHGSRALLNQLAYQYFLPVFDMGVQIDSVDGRIVSMAGRAQMLSPGLPCLQCQSLLDPEEVRRDLMSEVQKKADPYIVGEAVPQPAVISLNSTVSSLAITMFLAAVTQIDVRPRRLNYRILDGVVKPVTSSSVRGCIVCSPMDGAFGKADSWPLPVRPDN